MHFKFNSYVYKDFEGCALNLYREPTEHSSSKLYHRRCVLRVDSLNALIDK